MTWRWETYDELPRRSPRREYDEAVRFFRGCLVAIGISMLWWAVFVVLPLVAYLEGWLR